MATLEGWAVSVDVPGAQSIADHTYVVSSDGKKWGCWGRSDKGSRICSGGGDSGKSTCLSQPLGTAGIVYALTGVCHQTANRILRPSRQTVSKAKAYLASWALYGSYGGQNRVVDPQWKFQEVHCNIWDWRPDPVYAVRDTDELGGEHFEAMHALRLEIVRSKDDPNAPEIQQEFRNLELAILMKERLGKKPDDAVIQSITSSHDDMLGSLHPAMRALMREANGIQYAADRANSMANQFLASAAQSLTSEDYEKLFDFPKGQKIIVADPAIVARITSMNQS